MKYLAIFLIRCYKITLSPIIGNECRFHPRCSSYALEAFRQHRFLKAMGLTLRRILRCNPWVQGGYDPVPPRQEDQKRAVRPQTDKDKNLKETDSFLT